MFQLFLIFFIIPLVELYFLIKIGSIIGPFNTIMLIVTTALLGGYFAKREGLKTLYKIRESMLQGIMPAEELIDAALIFIGGLLLLTPGFITDISGILLIIPSSREVFKRYCRKWIKIKIEKSITYY